MDFEAKIEQMANEISILKKTAENLKGLGSDFPAVDRNIKRILASIKMLELNVSDLRLKDEMEI